MTSTPSPPKPRLVLRIGVTGHRPVRFPAAAQQAVHRTLIGVFGQLREAAAALQRREIGYFAAAPPEIRIVSALAEGADRVAAQAGLEAGCTLDAILPFPADLYETDFDGEQSKAEFRALGGRARASFALPGGKSANDPAVANRAYEAAGLMTLRQCDLLVAVWDGKESEGRGGTEDIVQRAVEGGRPVLRFDERGNGPFLLDGGLMPTDARDLAARTAAGPAVDAAGLAALVERLCAPPAGLRLGRYLKEPERRLLLTAPWFPLLLTLFGGKRGFWRSFRQPPYLAAAEAAWRPYWSELAPADGLFAPLRDIVMARFAWADGLANRYSQLHRSGYIRNYVLAAAAVMFAAFGVLARHGEVWQACEFFTIAVIAVATVYGRIAHWHGRWLDYRQLSAQLRHVRALALTGSSSFEARPLHSGDEGAEWVNWYSRMTAREIGVFAVTVDGAYVDTIRRAVARGEIGDQLDYHRANAWLMRRIGRWLDRFGFVAFGATFLVCLVEVAVWLGGWHRGGFEGLHGISGALTVVLPAVGAALFGIRVHGDFEGSAERSAGMTARLGAVLQRLDAPDSLGFAELSALTEYAVLIMAGELGDWGFVYRGRPLALPT